MKWLGLVLAGVSALLPAGAGAADPDFLLKWGQFGTAAGQFRSPHAIAVSDAGRVYVLDTGNFRVQVFSTDSTYLGQWGTSGKNGIAVDASGNVYVTETATDGVEKYTADGTLLARWGSSGSGDGQFDNPFGIAVDADGNIYVSDTGNARIQKFTSNGTYLAQWDVQSGGSGSGPAPCGIAVDASANVFVVNCGEHRVEKYDSQGTLLTQWGRWGSEPGEFVDLTGIAVDGGGNVYTVELGAWAACEDVQVFTNDGVWLDRWGSCGAGDGQFDGPWGVAVDHSGKVFVLDTNNNRVQKFGQPSVPVMPATWGRLKVLYR